MADGFSEKLGEAFVLLRGDGSQLDADLKKEREKLEKELEGWSDRFKGIGKAMSVGLTAPILAIGAAAVKVGLDFDDALDSIRIQTGATGEALEGLEDSFRAVFENVPSSAEEVSQALGAIHQRTGLTGTALETLTTQVLTLSRVTKTDLNTTIQESVRLFAAWNVPTEQQGEKLDFLFKVSQKTGASMSTLMNGLTQFGPTLRAFNIGFEDSVVLLGQFEKAGMDSGMAMAALRKAAANFAKEGVDFNVGLEDAVKRIKELGPGLASTTLALDVFGNKAGTIVADAIHKGVFSLKEFRAEIEKSPESIMGAANATDNFSEKLGKFQNKMQSALEPLGTHLLNIAERAIPMLEKIAGAVLAGAQAFDKLPGPVKDTAVAVGLLVAAAGPATYAIGTLIGSAKNIATAFGTAQTAVAGMTKALPALGSAALIAGQAALVAATAWASWEIGKKIGEVSGATDWIGKKLAGALYGVSEAEYEATNAARKANEQRKQSIPTIQELTKQVGTNAVETGKAAVNAEKEAEKQRKAAEAKAAAAEATKKYNEELKALNDQFSGKQLIANAEKYLVVLKQIGGATKLTSEESKDMNDVFGKALDKLKALGKVGSAEWNRIADAWMSTLRVEVVNGIGDLQDDIAKLPKVHVTPPFTFDMPKVVSGISAEMAAEFAKTAIPINFKGASIAEQLFGGLGTAEFGKKLAQNIIGAIQQGGGGKIIGSTIGATIGASVGETGGKIIGSLATKAISGVAGKAIGSAIGAAAGSIVPVVGTLIGGAIGGWIGGMFGGGEKKKVQEALGELVKGAGGMDELKRKADAAGYSLEKLFNAKDMKTFNKEVENLNKALAENEKKWQGINNAVQGVNTFAQGLTMQLEKQKEATEGNRESWDRLGKFTFATLAEQIRMTGDVIGAVMSLEPAFQALISAQEKFGFVGSEATEKVLGLYKTISENKDVFTTISGISQAMKGLGDVMKHSGDLALAFGQELAAQFKILQDRGVDTTQALALLQPQLQQLWMLQKEGKLVTDETTQALLDQAEAQGLVGEHMKDVNEKILDVLLAIGEALGATIPNSVKKFADSVSNITVPPIDVEVRYRETGRPENVDGADVPPAEAPPEFAKGGIANFGLGTTAVLHGMEAVIPLERLDEFINKDNMAGDLDGLMQAIQGLSRPDITIAPDMRGALATDMQALARELLPMIMNTLRDSGALRDEFFKIQDPS